MEQSGTSEPDGNGEANYADPDRIQNKTCEKMTPETRRTLPSTAAGDSSDTDLESDDLKNMYEPCPYCGAFFEVEELVEHASLCEDISRIKAVEISLDEETPFSTEVGGSDSMGETSNSVSDEPCPYCGAFFEVEELVEHASLCKDISTIKAVEISLDEETPFSTEVGGSDSMGETSNSVSDKDLCKQEEPCGLTGSDEELSHEDDNDLLDTNDANENNENYVDNESNIDNYNNDESSVISDNTNDDDDDDDDDDGDDDKYDELIDCRFCGTKLPIDVISDHYSKCEEENLKIASRCLEESHLAGVSLTSNERTASSLDSYHDCEEQCLYCLKMFPVSVLVEHACNCTGLDQSSIDANEFERCLYCLRTFPLDELINHVQDCDQRFVCQEDTQDDDIADSQSKTEKVLERCMYCFKDFPVSELIRHSESCDGNMSGPRERFQGFLPSVHDLSAISSVAILNDTQRSALQYVITRSALDSRNVVTDLLARVQGLGYTENDLKRTLQWVRSASPIIIHINLDKVLQFLVEDTHYRNQFETGTSGGSTNIVARKSWEDRIFNKAYQSSSPSERVKYGVLNIVGDPRGVRKCSPYGDSFLQLKKVRLRTTFASQDTSGAEVKLSCCEHYENVLFAYSDQEITAIMDVATGKVPFHRSDCISHYKEVQIHGPLSLSENVECIVVNPRHQKESLTTKLLDRFVEKNKCNLIWMDPDDQSGAAPSPAGS